MELDPWKEACLLTNVTAILSGASCQAAEGCYNQWIQRKGLAKERHRLEYESSAGLNQGSSILFSTVASQKAPFSWDEGYQLPSLPSKALAHTNRRNCFVTCPWSIQGSNRGFFLRELGEDSAKGELTKSSKLHFSFGSTPQVSLTHQTEQNSRSGWLLHVRSFFLNGMEFLNLIPQSDSDSFDNLIQNSKLDWISNLEFTVDKISQICTMLCLIYTQPAFQAFNPEHFCLRPSMGKSGPVSLKYGILSIHS